MLSKIIEFALKNRIFVVAGAALLFVASSTLLGGTFLRRLP